jgi:hypothetical protein
MTDYFALFDEPRRPWIDPEILKAKFVGLSAQLHPDRVHVRPQSERQAANQRYLELNAAYNCLRDPKTRLAHLLEVERGSKPDEVQNIPPGTVDLFMELTPTCREADAHLAERSRITSPLLKAQLMERGLELTDRLGVLRAKLEARRSHLVEQLKLLNMAWESAPEVGSANRLHVLPCGRLEQIYREISYLSPWTQQIHERIAHLSM